MSLPDVRRALGDPRASLEGTNPDVDLEACAYLDSKALLEAFLLMFSEGRLVRIEVFDAGIRTASGAGVGDAEESVKQLYPGRITVEPHHYVPEGHYLRSTAKAPDDCRYGMVFETDGKVVTSLRTGTLAALSLVEGCS